MKTKKFLITATFGAAAMTALSGCASSRFDHRPAYNVPVMPPVTAPLDPVQSLPLPALNNTGLPAGVSRVAYAGYEAPGTILIDIAQHRLYHVQGDGTANAYPIASPRNGADIPPADNVVTAKKVNPTWTPTENMRKRKPSLPAQVPGGVPENPLGVRALYLGSSLFRIHGTNEPQSIGTNASSGCIRMLNEHVTDLYDRVAVGTAVRVYRNAPVPGIGVRTQTPAYNF
jgi:lipoprotein-anchoring transpeptidase ErfK/SrfK